MRRYRSKAEWASILEEYSCSGQSLEVFSRERGISPSSMYRRLRKLNCGEGEFVELPRPWMPSQYEVLVNGVTLRIPSSETANRIAELVKALGC
jgi:hypothetical protein